jgi:hypothetical protein
MEEDGSSELESARRLPRLSKEFSNVRRLLTREFETFLIMLMNDGIELSILKILIDQEFGYNSPTKGYDHINILCKERIKDPDNPEKKIPNPKWLAEKKKIKVDGKNTTRIFVRPKIRENYEKYMLPTILNMDDSLKEILREYIEGIKEEEKVRDKFKAYTETIILALNGLIREAPTKSLNSQRFQKKIKDTIMKYFRSEILKYEVFSK